MDFVRRPQNVHVYHYRMGIARQYEYAMLQRSDNPLYWQGVSGGVRDKETPKQAALRVSAYEAGTPANSTIYEQHFKTFLPRTIFSGVDWHQDILLVPQYYFAIPFSGNLRLSEQHTAYKWCGYEEAMRLIYWQSQQTALFELNGLLLVGKIPGVS